MIQNTNNNIQNNSDNNSITDEHSPFKCRLCECPSFTTTREFATHVHYKHKKDISLEEYYKKYITVEMFKNFAVNDVLKSSLPYESRITDVCLECKSSTCKFLSFGKGFSVFCSEKCSNISIEQKKNVANKTKIAIKNKYGVDNPSQIKGNAEKVKKTKKERYGDENYNNPDKMKETNKKLYGVDNYTQTQEYIDKVRKTSQEKYGVEHFTQNKTIKNKVIVTNNERYGVDHPLQNIDIRKKVDDTNIKKYGEKSVLTLSSTRESLKKATNQKYGVDHVWQSPEIRERGYKILNDRFVKRLEQKQLIGITLIDADKKEFNCDYCQNNFIAKDISLNERAGIRAPRCHKCFPMHDRNVISLEEKGLLTFLEHNLSGEIVLKNHKGLIDSNPQQEVDIYFPAKKIAIEYNGTRWHAEIIGNKKQNYHLQKTKKLWDVGIRLIHVFSDDWKNKNTILKNKLLHILSANKKDIIHARKCKISFAGKNDIQELNNLYNNNHIQGTYKKSSKHVIAKYNDKIIAGMSFSFQIKKQTIELERFCTDINYNITGVASRLFKMFINKTALFGYNNIVSFADICWTHPENNLYNSLGFVKESSLPPRYWYLEQNKENKLHRFNFRKRRLSKLLKSYNPALTEWDNMYAHGYDRIWDCGLYRYVYCLNKI